MTWVDLSMLEARCALVAPFACLAYEVYGALAYCSGVRGSPSWIFHSRGLISPNRVSGSCWTNASPSKSGAGRRLSRYPQKHSAAEGGGPAAGHQDTARHRTCRQRQPAVRACRRRGGERETGVAGCAGEYARQAAGGRAQLLEPAPNAVRGGLRDGSGSLRHHSSGEPGGPERLLEAPGSAGCGQAALDGVRSR